jgi:hypothetical protein
MLIVVGLSAVGGFFVGKNIGVKNEKISGIVNNDIVSIQITNKQSMPSGTGYTIIIKNMSKYVIKQNSVYISYPIKHDNSQSMNKCKVEATGNKLDIKPNEEVTLNAFIPIENYKDNKNIDNNRPQYEISGYLNEVSLATHFGKSGGFAQ